MFEGAHFHLLVNHVAFFALIFGALILLVNLKWGGREVFLISVGLFVIAGVFTFIAHESGEIAEHAIKGLLSEADKAIFETHEDASKFANLAGYLTTAVALIATWIAFKKPARLTLARVALLIVSVWACTVFARVAYLGGLIRHTEIRTTQAP